MPIMVPSFLLDFGDPLPARGDRKRPKKGGVRLERPPSTTSQHLWSMPSRGDRHERRVRAPGTTIHVGAAVSVGARAKKGQEQGVRAEEGARKDRPKTRLSSRLLVLQRLHPQVAGVVARDRRPQRVPVQHAYSPVAPPCHLSVTGPRGRGRRAAAVRPPASPSCLRPQRPRTARRGRWRRIATCCRRESGSARPREPPPAVPPVRTTSPAPRGRPALDPRL